METAENALAERVMALLGHLEDTPAVAAVLPFTVSYLVWRVREAMLVGTNIDGALENIFSKTP
ncbi:MAG: hypothetical protein Q7R45_04095 [Sulfuricaulis sp.]|nr:hypothetical protein [Sulfuricaulis sp.]